MTTTEPSLPPSLSTVPLVGVAVNAALAAIKILAGFFGNSYALIADGIESTADIVTSLVVWGGLRVSVAPLGRRPDLDSRLCGHHHRAHRWAGI